MSDPCRGWVKPSHLPSNAEIRDEIQRRRPSAGADPGTFHVRRLERDGVRRGGGETPGRRVQRLRVASEDECEKRDVSGPDHRYVTIRLNFPLKYVELRVLHKQITRSWEDVESSDLRLLVLVAEKLLTEEARRGMSKHPWERVAGRLRVVQT